MTVHLLVPKLFWPAAAGAAPYRDLPLPGLETLLARARREALPGASLERWLAAAYGLSDRLPLAPFALSGDGGEPGDAWWLQADPVHLRFHRDQLFLADATRFALDAGDAEALVASLNSHFAQDGVTFVAPAPHRWYLRLSDEPRIVVRPTSELAGRSVSPFLPEGPDATRWRRVFNETQMLLHEHPCNRARESRDALAVNSVWFWGPGRRQPLRQAFDHVWCDPGLAAGLASASGSGTELPPESVEQLPADSRDSNKLIVLAGLPEPSYGDVDAWQDALTTLDRRWFSPILGALRSGRLSAVVLHALGAERSVSAALNRGDLLRFWRLRRPLASYAA